MDARLRKLQQAAIGGGPQEQIALIRERIRSGDLPRDSQEARDMIANCDRIGLEAFGLECGDLQIMISAGTRKRFNGTQAEAIIRSYYHALGYAEDSRSTARALLSPDEQTKVMFKATVTTVMRGGRGRWLKYTGGSKIKTAENLVAAARQRSEGGDAKGKLKARRKKATKKKAATAANKSQLALALRLAIVRISSTMSPGDREAVLTDSAAYGAYADEVSARANAAQIHPGDTVEKIDSLLSIKNPPVPLLAGTYEVSGKRIKYNAEHQWVDKTLGRRIRIWKHGKRNLGVELGEMPISPFSHRVPQGRNLRGDGFSASLVADKGRLQARLFMIMSSKPRTGLGTKYLRAWCNLLTNYGAESTWIAEAVGDQGLSFLAELEYRGEIEITGQRGSNLFVRCHRLLTDKRQSFLFGAAKKRK